MIYRALSVAGRLAGLLFIVAAASLATAQQFGTHKPHGEAAVNYLYGSNGTWKSVNHVTVNGVQIVQPLQHIWSWYGPNCSTPPCADYHPANVCAFTPLTQSDVEINKFTQFGQSQQCNYAQCNHTAPDANCLILFDTDNNGSLIGESISGNAFMEHRDRARNGAPLGLEEPRFQFWFDDNWIARYMSMAYGRSHPIGLHDSPANPGAPREIRWRVLGGDNGNWSPYGDNFIDRLALDGIYYANAWQFANAKAKWDAILALSNASYDPQDQRYEYQFSIKDAYYYGLWAILSERLLAQWPSFSGRNTVLQHAVSLRSNILTMQERTNEQLGTRLGWRTTCDAPTLPTCIAGDANGTLINTETTAAMVLGLGAEAWRVYEPGFSPLTWCTTCSYFNRPHHAFSGVVGLSSPGDMVNGPNATFPAGYYAIDFHFRMGGSSGAQTPAVYFAINHGGVVADSRVLYTSDLPANNEWLRERLVFYTAGNAATSFQVYWYGNQNIDVGSIRVKPL